MMRDFEDTQIIQFFKQNNVEKQTVANFCKKEFRQLDLNNPIENWLATAYYYARHNNLTDYQARSFASELTLFITGKMINTDVELIYKESLIDNHFYKIFGVFKTRYGEDSTVLWDKFIEYMINFYSSKESWRYERKTKPFLLKLTENETKLLDEMNFKTLHDIIVFLLENYDGKTVVDYKRDFPASSTTKTILSESEYSELMRVPVKTKTGKFCNILYFHHQNSN
jgi:hypothetical protein